MRAHARRPGETPLHDLRSDESRMGRLDAGVDQTQLRAGVSTSA
jgi:hypothetical protein